MILNIIVGLIIKQIKIDSLESRPINKICLILEKWDFKNVSSPYTYKQAAWIAAVRGPVLRNPPSLPIWVNDDPLLEFPGIDVPLF